MVKITTHEDMGYQTLDLTLGVGPGRANNTDDVTYVQYLLNKIMQSRQYASARVSCGSHGRKLSVDGIIGPRTKSQINAFQKFAKVRGYRILNDGCVDKCIRKGRGEFLYTLIALEREVYDIHGCWVEDFVNDYDFPSGLLSACRALGDNNKKVIREHMIENGLA